MATAQSYFTSLVFLHPVLYDSSSQLSKMQQKRIYKTWMSALLACFPIEFRIQWHPNNKRWGCKPNQLHLRTIIPFACWLSARFLPVAQARGPCPSAMASCQIHFNFCILPKWLTVVHVGMLHASVTMFSCRMMEKKATKDGATSFSASLHSLATSTIPSSVTAPWWREANFHAVLANQLYSKEDPPLKLFKGQRGQGMKLPWHCISTSSGRVQGIFKCNHPWNCVKDNFLCPHIHTSASFSHHHIVPITSRNSFCTSHFFASLSARGSTAWVQCADWSYLSSQTPGKWHSSGAPIGDN